MAVSRELRDPFTEVVDVVGGEISEELGAELTAWESEGAKCFSRASALSDGPCEAIPDDFVFAMSKTLYGRLMTSQAGGLRKD
jgi:hypothetical protein